MFSKIAVLLGAPTLQNELSSNLKMIGGQDADIKDYPWLASLQIFGQHYCGGSLISDRWVVTSAECIYTEDILEAFFTVRVGSSDFNNGGQTISVKRYIIHPKYDASGSSENNIALLELATAMNFGPSVSAASLPVAGEAIPDNSNATITGWGAVDPSLGPHSILQSVSVPTIDQKICKSAYNGRDITDDMFCAGLFGIGGKDICRGDFGTSAAINKQVIGIASFSMSGCTNPFLPTVFTKVSLFRDWMNQNTGI